MNKKNLIDAEAKKKRAKILKITGGAVLFLSFITQNYLYDIWNSRKQDLHLASVDAAIMNKGVLLNEILYFVSSLGKGSLKPEEVEQIRWQKIREAARKIAMSNSIFVLVNDLDKQDKVNVANDLMARADAVKDYYSYSEFMGYFNSLDQKYFSTGVYSEDIREKRDIARHVYLGLYILGSFLVLAGVKFE